MTKELLIILACVPLYIINSFGDKYVSSISSNKHSSLYNCIKFLIGSLCLLPCKYAKKMIDRAYFVILNIIDELDGTNERLLKYYRENIEKYQKV